MTRIKSRLSGASLLVALVLELALAPGLLAKNTQLPPNLQGNFSRVKTQNRKQSPLPPPPPNPSSTAPGGQRGSNTCPQDPDSGQALIALSPANQPGLTLAERPTFLVYVPQTRAQTAEFSLSNRNGSGVYRTTIALTNTPGIITVSLPPTTSPLEIGKHYIWVFSLVCTANNRFQDAFTSGRIQRIGLDPVRLRQIEQATPRERVSLYREAGIWYETSSILLELQRSQPNDLGLRQAWRDLLESGGLEVTSSE
ncbi:DUF928 domain-containing protein [Leptolyngbya sp. FACHB-261]|uniref:DUF928 domain-containing protein n=1 Tax=Leptolyngbya sp. FACHB-261 TaxID=2692806 RepID=UPI001688766E|nr:DUF928 domain-containing protein [Leptolyngbya sp. FACHB-261]MBD2103926.1 DUF928 domain-containing protein [Leptolyngbya sp. FACHB-261]